MLLMVSVLGVLTLGTASILDSWARLQTNTEKFEEVLLLDRILDTILANVVPFTWPEDTGTPTPPQFLEFQGTADHLITPYLHRFNRLEDGAIRFCGFFLEGESFVVYYCDRPPFPEDLGADGVRRVVLANNVKEVSFFYADLQDDVLEFEESWDEENEYLPLAVMVQIEWNDGMHENWLRRTAGSDFYGRWGKWQQNRAVNL